MPDVRVTNHNDFPLKGRFAGQDYFFPAGAAVTIPEKAAEHIFALDQEREQKTGALNRLRLLKPGDTLEKAFEALDKMEFHQGHTVFDEPEPVPPPQDIGEHPGAPRSPGGESEAGPGSSPPVSAADALLPPGNSAVDALARKVLQARTKRGG